MLVFSLYQKENSMNNFEFITPSVAPPARLNRNQYGWGVVFPLEKVYPLNYGKVLRQQKV